MNRLEETDKNFKDHEILIEKQRITMSLVLLLIVIVVIVSIFFWHGKISQQLYAAFIGLIFGATLLELILRRK